MRVAALGADDAVVLRRQRAELFPARTLTTDVAQFCLTADVVLASDASDGWRAAAAAYGGDLLPESLYEEWTQVPRRVLRARYVEVWRRGQQWERLVEADPTDEPAHRELMRAAMEAGNRHGAVQWYGRLRMALLRDVGVLPDGETDALYDECVAGLGVADPVFVGRQLELHASGPRFGAMTHRRPRCCSFGDLLALASPPCAFKRRTWPVARFG